MKSILAALIAAALAATPKASAQDVSTQQGPASESSEPSIGDIMTQQQARHIKLWYAGRAGNWPLADYEVDKLKDGFDDVNKELGGDLVEKEVGGAISALEAAVDGKDRAAFTSAYDKLTAGCNNCHHALDHAFIVIERPSLLPFSDQSFATQKQ